MFFPPVSSKTNVTSSSLISSASTFNRIRPMPIEYLEALCKYDRVSADYVLAFKDSFLHHTQKPFPVPPSNKKQQPAKTQVAPHFSVRGRTVPYGLSEHLSAKAIGGQILTTFSVIEVKGLSIAGERPDSFSCGMLLCFSVECNSTKIIYKIPLDNRNFLLYHLCKQVVAKTTDRRRKNIC